jgi:hypothetical protein
MTRLRTILKSYKENRMARPKHRLDIETDKLYQLARRVSQGMANRINDMVNHPPHYTKGGIETIDYMEAKSTPEEFAGHLRLTALKYLSRTGHKDDALQDLKKAQWYVNRLVNFAEKEIVKSK